MLRADIQRLKARVEYLLQLDFPFGDFEAGLVALGVSRSNHRRFASLWEVPRMDQLNRFGPKMQRQFLIFVEVYDCWKKHRNTEWAEKRDELKRLRGELAALKAGPAHAARTDSSASG